MGKNGLLSEGDIIEIKEGHKIYTELPEHCFFENRFLVFDKTATMELVVGSMRKGFDTSVFVGKYVVTKTENTGGSEDGDYPNGHKVHCKILVCEKPLTLGAGKISFYQTGSFTAMIEDIIPIGKVVATGWEIVKG